MAWTAPRTWVTGEIPTAAIFNTHVRDNLLFLFPHNQFANNAQTVETVRLGTLTTGFYWTWSSSPATATRDATHKYIYYPITQAGIGHVEGGISSIPMTTELLPDFRWTFAHETVTSSATCRTGLATSMSAGNPTDGVLFRGVGNANWFATVYAGGVEGTPVDTTIAASTTPRDFRIRFISATSAEFSIDGTVRATISAGLPAVTALLQFRVALQSTSGTVVCRMGPNYSYAAMLKVA